MAWPDAAAQVYSHHVGISLSLTVAAAPLEALLVEPS
jgi:hypothetical protein